MPNGLRIVLVSPRNPLNIGAAARAMSNFGFADLRVVNPYDVAFREARSAVHSEHVLAKAEVFADVAAAVRDCTLVVGTTSVGHRDLRVPLYRLETAGRMIRSHGEGSGVALLFGSEKFGLSNEEMSHCHWLLRIPTRAEHGSMNLGQAVAICLYELRRDDEFVNQAFPRPDTASAEHAEQLTELLLDLLSRSGYINPRTSKSAGLKVRRLVRRLGLPDADAETWLGILRQFLWKMQHPDCE